MKKITALFALAFSLTISVSGQEVRYRDLKKYYDPKDYAPAQYDDKYSPFLSGFCSFLIPGAGQAVCGEWGRGLGFFGASAAFSALELAEASLMFYGASLGQERIRQGQPYDDANKYLLIGMVSGIVTLAADLGVRIFCICDAVNVAKVKDLYYRDRSFTSIDMRLEPQLALVPQACSGTSAPVAGLSLKLSF